MKAIGIIPSRLASSRLPAKPLARIGGITMIEHVYRRASEALDEVVVATDSDLIASEVTRFGGRAVITDPAIPNGTIRCVAALDQLDADPSVVVNIQGDEPFIDPADISRVAQAILLPDAEIATLASRFDPADGYESIADPSRVKVVTDDRSNALLFSRSVIPFVRDYPLSQWPEHASFLIHSGLYAYRPETLRNLVALPHSDLEQAENLEQLRWLQAGYRIKVLITDRKPFGIDTPADLERANKLLATNHLPL